MTATVKQNRGAKSNARNVVCFGEVLWDCLPEGLFFGGAPANVAYHLAKLGNSVKLISRVGDDFPGREAVRRAEAAGICCNFVGVSEELETGNVLASLDADGNATYSISHPVAWDQISVPQEQLSIVEKADAILFGSLAARDKVSRNTLLELLDLKGPRKFFDVNLRFPHFTRSLVLDLASRADVLKLNGEELALLLGKSLSPDEVEKACEELSVLTGCRTICATLGADGAVYWTDGRFLRAVSKKVTVVDTVGAGDAFMAALVHTVLHGRDSTSSAAWLAACCELGAFVASRKSATPAYLRSEIPSALLDFS